MNTNYPMIRRLTGTLLVIAFTITSQVRAEEESMSKKFLGFVGGYLAGKVMDSVWDAATGKPDVDVMSARLRAVEQNVAENMQRPITKLRTSFHANMSKEEYLAQVGAVMTDLGAVVEDHEARIATIEKALAEKGIMSGTRGIWIFPDSGVRKLDASDLRRLSVNELWEARNEIYVRSGFIFTTDRGKAFARRFGDLYAPRIASQATAFERLNKIEQANILLIQKYEKEN